MVETDPDAFVAVQNTEEVIGTRFLTWEAEGYRPQRPNPLPATQDHREEG